MTLPNLLIPTCMQLLQALSNWLAKAEAQLGEGGAEALLSARLAPDMFPLATQIRFACVQAWEGVSRLRNEPFPLQVATLLNEGRDAGERPGSIAEAQARIAETIAMLGALDPATLAVEDDAALAHKIPNGMIFDLTAGQYVRDWALPQFYFHLMAAYAILRAQGVALGKPDYVAHMFAYLRPGTMPAPQ